MIEDHYHDYNNTLQHEYISTFSKITGRSDACLASGLMIFMTKLSWKIDADRMLSHLHSNFLVVCCKYQILE